MHWCPPFVHLCTLQEGFSSIKVTRASIFFSLVTAVAQRLSGEENILDPQKQYFWIRSSRIKLDSEEMKFTTVFVPWLTTTRLSCAISNMSLGPHKSSTGTDFDCVSLCVRMEHRSKRFASHVGVFLLCHLFFFQGIGMGVFASMLACIPIRYASNCKLYDAQGAGYRLSSVTPPRPFPTLAFNRNYALG